MRAVKIFAVAELYSFTILSNLKNIKVAELYEGGGGRDGNSASYLKKTQIR